MNAVSARPLHRRLAPWLAAPLALAALTGLTYRVGRTWFGMDKETGHRVLEFHTGEWMGETAGHLYVALTGLGLLALVLTGAWLLTRPGARSGPRRPHKLVGWFLVLPLFVTAVSGLAYHFGKAWFGLEESTLKLLMSLHQGSWLGPKGRPYYVLLVGLGLLFLIATGLAALRAKGAKKTGA